MITKIPIISQGTPASDNCSSSNLLSSSLMVYLKTTNTCQLDCDHCFTNGRNGEKGWFDVPKTINFFHRLKKYKSEFEYGDISFHGGEPMLCPSEMMFDVWHGVKDLWPTIRWSVQTNLTYPLTPDKVEVFDVICDKSLGTSWDKGIRWPDLNKELLWKQNVQALTSQGYEITTMVCLTSNIVNEMEPIDIINELSELGIQNINFERVTPNGNATRHQSIFPDNKALDAWFLKMWHQCVEHKTYKYVRNMFFNSILSSFVYRTHSGCRCRQCEQKVLTINADGSVGGCPNSAVTNTFGHITDDIKKLLNSEGRICNIQAEATRHPACWSCEVFNVCNGDCHQLAWQDNICAAPKSLMIHLMREQDIELYKLFLNDFIGQE